MKEIQKVRQIPGEAKRRWFSGATMDLIVWFDDQENVTGFQLCYDKGQAERAITWTIPHGFSHMNVDDGDSPFGVGYKATPVLISGGAIDIQMINDLFMANQTHLPDQLADFVTDKLHQFFSQHKNASDVD